MIPGIGKAVLHGAVLLLGARLLLVVLGFLKFMLLAWRFGSGPASDAYFTAYNLVFLITIGTEGILVPSFVPVFIEYREQGNESEAWRMTANLFGVLLKGFLVVALGIALTAPFIVRVLAPGLDPGARQECIRLLRVFAPQIPLAVLCALFGSLYYARQQFRTPALFSLLPICGSLAGLFLFSSRLGIMALPLGALVGRMLQTAALAGGFQDRLAILWTRQARMHAGTRRILRLAVPRFVGLSVVELDLLVDKFCASLLGGGMISAITYSSRIPAVATGLMTAPLGKSLLPSISRMAAKSDPLALAEILRRSMRLLVILIAPVGAFLFTFHQPIVTLLFERGAFEGTHTAMTAFPLRFYTLGILFFGINPLLRWTFFAFKDTLTPLKIGLIASVCNLGLNLALMPRLAQGGIALSTTLVALFSTLMLVRLLHLRLPGLSFRTLAADSLKPLGCALFAGLCMHALSRVGFPRAPFLPLTAKLAAVGLIGGGIHLLGCCLLGVCFWGPRSAPVIRFRRRGRTSACDKCSE